VDGCGLCSIGVDWKTIAAMYGWRFASFIRTISLGFTPYRHAITICEQAVNVKGR
jgi:hypothetical protein